MLFLELMIATKLDSNEIHMGHKLTQNNCYTWDPDAIFLFCYDVLIFYASHSYSSLEEIPYPFS